MKRRGLLVAGAAVSAAAAGAGWRVWQTSRPAGPEQALWELRFASPDGSELAMHELLGRPLLLNFWATWCPPCVKEMPLLDHFHREQPASGIRVMGLAVDGLAPVRAFLQRQPVAFPIGLAGFEGTELSRRLGNTNGGLPFSVLFDRSGSPLSRKLGALTREDLSGWTKQLGP